MGNNFSKYTEISITIGGRTDTRLYHVWCKMRHRCKSAYDTNYHSYGARGIKVCKKWDNSFIEFAKWAVKSGYTDELCINRINNDGHYSPSNCNWLTIADNTRNTRRRRIYTAFGVTKTQNEWARDERCVVSRNALDNRLRHLKWDIERALTTPRIK